MDALLITLPGILGGRILGFVVAGFSGAIVPGTRVTERETTIARLQAAAEKRDEAYQTLKTIVDRQALVAEVTESVLKATRDSARESARQLPEVGTG